MRDRRQRRRRVASVGVASIAVVGGLVGTGVLGAAGSPVTPGTLTPVAAANTKATGFTRSDVVSRELEETPVAKGADAIENPTPAHPYYGYDGDGPQVPAPGDVPADGHIVEATKTEPDKNTYLVLSGQRGADPHYDYGTHFLFQGHEGSGEITRVNLDADAAHRVTLLASTDTSGAALPFIDGSTWDPWARRLVFTSEEGTDGGVWQSTLDGQVQDVSGVFGRASYEGVQNDGDGNVWLVEDSGGSTGTVNDHAKQPNSFVYRFEPRDVRDLTKGGKLQVLQVGSLARPGWPIEFHAGQADADILSPDVRDLHTYGKTFTTRWVTIHDTATDGQVPFDANALAKAARGTPFKRPENAQFRPGMQFREFYFDETGDTDARSQANSGYGGYGSILQLSQSSPSSNTGVLRPFYEADQSHSSFDNVTFLSSNQVVSVQDAGDTLHTQANALDSAFVLDVTRNYGAPHAPLPVRMLAQGRDASATLDSQLGASPGFNNEGDNEITGIHASDGDPGTGGILGAKVPRLFSDPSWRLFYTGQHGDNVTYEITHKQG